MLREISLFHGAQWRWEDMCGPKGLHPWNPQTHDLGYCFQRLFLLIPSLFLLSIISAYYVGSHVNWVVRGKLQDVAISLRSLITLGLTIIPFVKIYKLLVNDEKHVMAIDYFTAGTECVAWLVHFGYILALRHRLGISPRGPILVLVVWSMTAVLSVISVRSMVLLGQPYVTELSVLVLQILYSFTLLPSEGVTSATYYSPCLVGSQYSQLREHQPLLQAYIDSESTLGVAMHGATCASKLLFHWVEPLFTSGLERKLNDPDDLFDLPVDLSCNSISTKVEKALIGNIDKYRVPVSHDQPLSRGHYGSVHSREDPSLMPRVEVVTPVKKFNVSLFKALHKCFGFEFYFIGFLKLISDISGFAGPLLLNKLVTYVEDTSIDVEMGYLYAGGLLLSSLLGAFCESHFNMLMSIVGIKLRTSIVTTVFKKSLSVTKTEMNNKFSVGEVTNFMSTDTDRIVNACPSFHAVWSIPLQLGVTLFLLHSQVGLAFLAGLVFSIVLIPINKYVANKIGLLSTKLMLHKDRRVSLMTEIIKGIKAIKFYVWEDYFSDKVSDVRANEMKYLKGRKYLDAICVFLWATTPVIVTALTLSTYVLLGNQLNAATVFTTIALLNMLIAPLNAFPWVLNGLTEAWVSMKRIQRLIDLQDLNEDQYYSVLSDEEISSNVVLALKNTSFTYGTAMKVESHENVQLSKNNKGKGKCNAPTEYRNIQRRDSSVEFSPAENSQINVEGPFVLSNLTFTVRQGDFVCIIGKVGSGKTSLINALLAEMIKLDGEISTSENNTGFGFVSQKPWLQRGTIMENILFGKTFDETKYRNVLGACGLTDDIALLGNNANVGEGGGCLSGGQVARIALARACYQDKQVYIFDDVLSAVDAKVGAHIYQKCIMGLLEEKTRIFVTHSLHYASHADHIIVMDNGTIVKQGPPKVILKDLDEFFVPSDYESDGELEAALNDGELPGPSRHIINSSKATKMDDISLNNDNVYGNINVMEEERQAVGSLDSWVLGMYWKSVGHWLALTTLLSLLLMQISRNTTDLWLSFWVSSLSPHNKTNYTSVEDTIHNNIIYLTTDTTNIENTIPIGSYIKNITEHVIKDIFYKHLESNGNILGAVDPNDGGDHMVSYYLSFYAGFAALNSVFTLIRSFIFAYGGIHAASVIHKKLFSTIIKGKMKYFDITPSGRILNRFSSDMYTVDDSLPFILNILLAQVFGVIGCILVTVYGLPWVCLVIVPLIPVYHWLQHRYRLTSRELKRISSVTLSPIYSYFNDTLEGATTIRVLSKSERWSRGGEYLLERSQQSVLCSAATGQWLGLRLRLMGAALLGGASAVAVAQRNLDVVDAGLVGLAISYALTITSLLGGVINAFTETEREMIAVERVGEYIRQIEPEGMDRVNIGLEYFPPPYGWPNLGILSFKDVVLKYRDHLSPSLKGVSFDTLPGEKIGVVGRTGAGKSSLFSALFRLCELYGGGIAIDSVDISKLSLDTLRSRIAIIPQEPFVFSGTIRNNLDPLAQYRDENLWNAIERCGAKQIIQQRGGLSASALNLSRGHLQLLCLARAILQNAKVLCIDEATANVDQETDKLIQSTIRCCFRKSTVLTIAHRISTILNCDRVLVMGDGQVIEFDSPKVLMKDPSSQFYQLLNQTVRG